MVMMLARDRTVAVVGLGKTGQSCIDHLLALGCRVVACDTRPSLPHFESMRSRWPSVDLRLGPLDETWLRHASEIVVSPGVSLQSDVLDRLAKSGHAVIGDSTLFRRAVNGPIVAITGSNAKSTVTSMVGEMLEASGMHAAVGGNLGVPMLDLLHRRADVYVLELSSFQLEPTEGLGAKVAVILNVSADHLDRHITMERYGMIKQRVYQGCEVAVFNRDDPFTQPLVPADVKLVSFGLNKPQGPLEWGLLGQGENLWLCKGRHKLLNAGQLQLRGRHNVVNVLAAMAIVESMGVTIAQGAPALEVAQAFVPLPHRCEWIGSFNNVSYINDSKGTNVGATVAAINGLGIPGAKKLIVILGGKAKGSDFSSLKESIAEFAKVAILIGEDASLIEQALIGCVDIRRCCSMDEAVQTARSFSEPGDTVLLSPACASFDMFDNFSHRGDTFKRCVLQLGQVAS